MHSQAGSSLQRTCRLIGCKLFSSFCVSPPSPMPEDQKNHSGSQLQYQWEQHKQQLEVMVITRRRIILTGWQVFCSRKQIGDVGFCRYCQGSPVKVENHTTCEEGQDLKKLECAIRLHVWLMKAGVVYIWSDHMLLVKIIRVFSIFSTFHCP